MKKEDMTQLDPVEIKRTYHFPDGAVVELRNVEAILVRPSGSHRLSTKDGILHIVPVGWIHIEIVTETSEWTI